MSNLPFQLLLPLPDLPARSPTLTFAVLLLVWWAANNFYAIDAELLFRRFQTPLLFVDLTLTQITVGILLSYLYLTFRPPPPSQQQEQQEQQTLFQRTLLEVSVPIFIIGILHYFGTLLTNISYSLIGSTSTLLWKLTEPLSSICLKRLVLHEATSPTSFIGVLITLSGVLLFSKSSFTLPKFSPIILANLIFPTRNVFIKKTQDRHESFHAFLSMLVTALPLCVLTFLLKIYLYGPNFSAMSYLLRNALLFNSYQLASFLLLEQLDVLTHSLLNTIKRFTGILLSMLVIRTPMQESHYHGIGITLIGFCVYLAAGRKRKFGGYGLALGVVIGFVAMGIMGSTVKNVLKMNEVQQVRMRDIEGMVGLDNFSTASSDIVREEIQQRQYVVQLQMDYHRNRRNVNYKSYEEAVDDEGGNVGNLVWQYGAHVALPDFRTVTLCHDEEVDICAKVAKKERKKLVQYLPLANNMNPEARARFSKNIAELEDNLDEIVVVGVGVQVEFRKNSSDPEFNSHARISYAVQDYDIPAATKRFLDLMTERGGKMLLRGDFTLNVTRRAGFQGSYSVGCPSFWINHDRHLGRSLEKKYRAIGDRIGDLSLKVAVNVKRVRGFVKQAIYLRDNYPNSRFYAQGKSDMRLLRNLEVPFERVRFFTDVEEWLADLKEMDIAYGVRIHGNMISLGAGLPVVVVASDWRVLELARVMKLPHLTTYDSIFEKELDVAQIVKVASAKFDAEAFDRNRCKVGKVYIEVLRRYGIGVKEHVKAVAGSC